MRVRPRVLRCWRKLGLAYNYPLVRWNIWLMFSSGLTVLTPDPRRSIDTCRLIIIISPGYHPANTAITPAHLQRINIIEGRKLLNYYRKTATTPPYLFRIGGRRNSLLFTLGTRGNINNR